MNAPTLITSSLAAAGAAALIGAQEVATVVGSGRSTEDIIKIIGAVGGLLVIVGGILTPLVSQIIKWRVEAALRPVTQQITTLIPIVAKVDELVPIVAGINAHVNSEKTRAEGENSMQKAQITLQREIIEEMKKAAALLAQAKASADAAQSVAQAAIAGATIPTNTAG